MHGTFFEEFIKKVLVFLTDSFWINILETFEKLESREQFLNDVLEKSGRSSQRFHRWLIKEDLYTPSDFSKLINGEIYD